MFGNSEKRSASLRLAVLSASRAQTAGKMLAGQPSGRRRCVQN
jgi:hypothetical protein